MAGRPLAARARLSMTAVAAVSVLAAAVVFLGAFAAWNVDVRGDELERQARALAAGLDENPDLAVGGLRERLFRVEARLIGATVAVTDARGTVLYSTAEAPPDSYPLERLGTLDADGVGRGVRALPRSGQAV
ncbi:MAG: hypothetical protein C0418_04470 [Coriobacteriaceae bacterium]|nr:hypothetical protein [Coriobacteriaceae bacterium]